jgi:hypothetical protein
MRRTQSTSAVFKLNTKLPITYNMSREGVGVYTVGPARRGWGPMAVSSPHFPFVDRDN